jgi:hypothetical protein
MEGRNIQDWYCLSHQPERVSALRLITMDRFHRPELFFRHKTSIASLSPPLMPFFRRKKILESKTAFFISGNAGSAHIARRNNMMRLTEAVGAECQ